MNDQADVVLGVDVGGTFTDVLALDRSRGTIVGAIKLPSTPSHPARGATWGVDRCQTRFATSAKSVFHGTTVGTNTLIEKTGGPSALITTAGFRDVLALRRQARPRLYDLAPSVSPPLVEKALRLEVDERIDARGRVLRPLDAEEVARVVSLLRDKQLASVAVCCLHAYANDAHEQLLGEALRCAYPDLFITLSSEICREFREFERTSTTVVNAYIGPRVASYVKTLHAELAQRGIASLGIVKSNGGLTAAANAARFPAQLIESGPAAGITAAAALGRAEGIANLIAFDMGGTTAKVGVVRDGVPRLANEFAADRFVEGLDLGGYPIKSPSIDMIEIGAGGGSIARVDAAGVLKVGPRSAGAVPGPACYGRGGEIATVTDAHMCLGHIAPEGFGAEDLKLNRELAQSAVRRDVALPLGWSVPRAAAGVIRLATASMSEMVRLATLRRGLDPREFVLVAFGGGGALHAAEIAREVGIPQVVVPPYPGLFSAIGTVLGDVRHDLVQTVMCLAGTYDARALGVAFDALRARAAPLIAAEEVNTGWQFEHLADLRFEGQLFELTLPVPTVGTPDGKDLERAFRAAYETMYGYDLPTHAVEVVSLRLVAKAPVWQRGWPVGGMAPRTANPKTTRKVYDDRGESRDTPVVSRAALAPGDGLEGPAIVEDFGATIRVLDGQAVSVRPSGVLIIAERRGE